jgi:hypothetical protein
MVLDGVVQGALMIAFGALGSLLLWVLVGRRIITKYGADAWISRLKDPDADMKAAIDSLVSGIFNEKMMVMAWNWFLTAQIPTGKNEVTDTGEERPITTTPYQSLIDATSRAILLRFKSMRGGLATQGNAALAAELGDIAPMIAQLGPRKGQSTAEWVLEQAMMKALQPGGMLDRKLKALNGEVSSTGAEGW